MCSSKSVPDSHVDCRLPGNRMPSAVSGLALKAGLSGSRARQPMGRETHFAVRTSSYLVQVPV